MEAFEHAADQRAAARFVMRLVNDEETAGVRAIDDGLDGVGVRGIDGAGRDLLRGHQAVAQILSAIERERLGEQAAFVFGQRRGGIEGADLLAEERRVRGVACGVSGGEA